jgi:hypothetical protein
MASVMRRQRWRTWYLSSIGSTDEQHEAASFGRDGGTFCQKDPAKRGDVSRIRYLLSHAHWRNTWTGGLGVRPLGMDSGVRRNDQLDGISLPHPQAQPTPVHERAGCRAVGTNPR